MNSTMLYSDFTSKVLPNLKKQIIIDEYQWTPYLVFVHEGVVYFRVNFATKKFVSRASILPGKWLVEIKCWGNALKPIEDQLNDEALEFCKLKL